MHRSAFTIDRRVSAVALEHESQSRRRMAVRWRGFARHDELNACIETRCDFRFSACAWVFEDEDAALGFLRANKFARFHEQRPDFVIAPEGWNTRGLRLGSHEASEMLPQ